MNTEDNNDSKDPKEGKLKKTKKTKKEKKRKKKSSKPEKNNDNNNNNNNDNLSTITLATTSTTDTSLPPKKKPSLITRILNFVRSHSKSANTTANATVDISIPSMPLLPPPRLLNESLIITEEICSKFPRICEAFPKGLQMKEWNLLYSTSKHGISLHTLYRRLQEKKGPTVLVVEDCNHFIFGAFLSEKIHVAKSYYGTGETFLFSVSPTVNVYKWTRKNTFFMICEEDSLAIGGGGTSFGLWLDESFDRGCSSPCDTFDNPTMASEEQFQCYNLEVWGFK